MPISRSEYQHTTELRRPEKNGSMHDGGDEVTHEILQSELRVKTAGSIVVTPRSPQRSLKPGGMRENTQQRQRYQRPWRQTASFRKKDTAVMAVQTSEKHSSRTSQSSQVSGDRDKDQAIKEDTTDRADVTNQTKEQREVPGRTSTGSANKERSLADEQKTAQVIMLDADDAETGEMDAADSKVLSAPERETTGPILSIQLRSEVANVERTPMMDNEKTGQFIDGTSPPSLISAEMDKLNKDLVSESMRRSSVAAADLRLSPEGRGSEPRSPVTTLPAHSSMIKLQKNQKPTPAQKFGVAAIESFAAQVVAEHMPNQANKSMHQRNSVVSDSSAVNEAFLLQMQQQLESQPSLMRSKDARGLGHDVPHCKHCRKAKVVHLQTKECNEILCCAIGCPFNFVESQDLAIMAGKNFQARNTAKEMYRFESVRRQKKEKESQRVGGVARYIDNVAYINFASSFDRQQELEQVFTKYQAVMKRMWNEYRSFVKQIETNAKKGQEPPPEVKAVLPVVTEEKPVPGSTQRSKQKRDGEIYLEILSQSFEMHREQVAKRQQIREQKILEAERAKKLAVSKGIELGVDGVPSSRPLKIKISAYKRRAGQVDNRGASRRRSPDLDDVGPTEGDLTSMRAGSKDDHRRLMRVLGAEGADPSVLQDSTYEYDICRALAMKSGLGATSSVCGSGKANTQRVATPEDTHPTREPNNDGTTPIILHSRPRGKEKDFSIKFNQRVDSKLAQQVAPFKFDQKSTVIVSPGTTPTVYKAHRTPLNADSVVKHAPIPIPSLLPVSSVSHGPDEEHDLNASPPRLKSSLVNLSVEDKLIGHAAATLRLSADFPFKDSDNSPGLGGGSLSPMLLPDATGRTPKLADSPLMRSKNKHKNVMRLKISRNKSKSRNGNDNRDTASKEGERELTRSTMLGPEPDYKSLSIQNGVQGGEEVSEIREVLSDDRTQELKSKAPAMAPRPVLNHFAQSLNVKMPFKQYRQQKPKSRAEILDLELQERRAKQDSRWKNKVTKARIDEVMDSGNALVNGWHEKLRAIRQALLTPPVGAATAKQATSDITIVARHESATTQTPLPCDVDTSIYSKTRVSARAAGQRQGSAPSETGGIADRDLMHVGPKAANDLVTAAEQSLLEASEERAATYRTKMMPHGDVKTRRGDSSAHRSGRAQISYRPRQEGASGGDGMVDLNQSTHNYIKRIVTSRHATTRLSSQRSGQGEKTGRKAHPSATGSNSLGDKQPSPMRLEPATKYFEPNGAKNVSIGPAVVEFELDQALRNAKLQDNAGVEARMNTERMKLYGLSAGTSPKAAQTQLGTDSQSPVTEKRKPEDESSRHAQFKKLSLNLDALKNNNTQVLPTSQAYQQSNQGGASSMNADENYMSGFTRSMPKSTNLKVVGDRKQSTGNHDLEVVIDPQTGTQLAGDSPSVHRMTDRRHNDVESAMRPNDGEAHDSVSSKSDNPIAEPKQQMQQQMSKTAQLGQLQFQFQSNNEKDVKSVIANKKKSEQPPFQNILITQSQNQSREMERYHLDKGQGNLISGPRNREVMGLEVHGRSKALVSCVPFAAQTVGSQGMLNPWQQTHPPLTAHIDRPAALTSGSSLHSGRAITGMSNMHEALQELAAIETQLQHMMADQPGNEELIVRSDYTGQSGMSRRLTGSPQAQLLNSLRQYVFEQQTAAGDQDQNTISIEKFRKVRQRQKTRKNSPTFADGSEEDQMFIEGKEARVEKQGEVQGMHKRRLKVVKFIELVSQSYKLSPGRALSPKTGSGGSTSSSPTFSQYRLTQNQNLYSPEREKDRYNTLIHFRTNSGSREAETVTTPAGVGQTLEICAGQLRRKQVSTRAKWTKLHLEKLMHSIEMSGVPPQPTGLARKFRIHQLSGDPRASVKVSYGQITRQAVPQGPPMILQQVDSVPGMKSPAGMTQKTSATFNLAKAGSSVTRTEIMTGKKTFGDFKRPPLGLHASSQVTMQNQEPERETSITVFQQHNSPTTINHLNNLRSSPSSKNYDSNGVRESEKHLNQIVATQQHTRTAQSRLSALSLARQSRLSNHQIDEQDPSIFRTVPTTIVSPLSDPLSPRMRRYRNMKLLEHPHLFLNRDDFITDSIVTEQCYREREGKRIELNVTLVKDRLDEKLSDIARSNIAKRRKLLAENALNWDVAQRGDDVDQKWLLPSTRKPRRRNVASNSVAIGSDDLRFRSLLDFEQRQRWTRNGVKRAMLEDNNLLDGIRASINSAMKCDEDSVFPAQSDQKVRVQDEARQFQSLQPSQWNSHMQQDGGRQNTRYTTVTESSLLQPTVHEEPAVVQSNPKRKDSSVSDLVMISAPKANPFEALDAALGPLVDGQNKPKAKPKSKPSSKRNATRNGPLLKSFDQTMNTTIKMSDALELEDSMLTASPREAQLSTMQKVSPTPIESKAERDSMDELFRKNQRAVLPSLIGRHFASGEQQLKSFTRQSTAQKSKDGRPFSQTGNSFMSNGSVSKTTKRDGPTQPTEVDAAGAASHFSNGLYQERASRKLSVTATVGIKGKSRHLDKRLRVSQALPDAELSSLLDRIAGTGWQAQHKSRQRQWFDRMTLLKANDAVSGYPNYVAQPADQAVVVHSTLQPGSFPVDLLAEASSSNVNQ